MALVIFTMITAAHVRIRAETGASLPILVLAIVAAGAVFVTFVFTSVGSAATAIAVPRLCHCRQRGYACTQLIREGH